MPLSWMQLLRGIFHRTHRSNNEREHTINPRLVSSTFANKLQRKQWLTLSQRTVPDRTLQHIICPLGDLTDALNTADKVRTRTSQAPAFETRGPPVAVPFETHRTLHENNPKRARRAPLSRKTEHDVCETFPRGFVRLQTLVRETTRREQ